MHLSIIGRKYWPRDLLKPFKWSRIIFFPWLIRHYSEEDAYNIRAEAKEIFDYENDWGELEIRMPKNMDQILSEIRNVAEMESIFKYVLFKNQELFESISLKHLFLF